MIGFVALALATASVGEMKVEFDCGHRQWRAIEFRTKKVVYQGWDGWQPVKRDSTIEPDFRFACGFSDPSHYRNLQGSRF